MTTTYPSLIRDEVFTDPEAFALTGFLAGCSGLTRSAYALDLRAYSGWLTAHDVRLFDAKRAVAAFEGEVFDACADGFGDA